MLPERPEQESKEGTRTAILLRIFRSSGIDYSVYYSRSRVAHHWHWCHRDAKIGFKNRIFESSRFFQPGAFLYASATILGGLFATQSIYSPILLSFSLLLFLYDILPVLVLVSDVITNSGGQHKRSSLRPALAA